MCTERVDVWLLWDMYHTYVFCRVQKHMSTKSKLSPRRSCFYDYKTCPIEITCWQIKNNILEISNVEISLSLILGVLRYFEATD